MRTVPGTDALIGTQGRLPMLWTIVVILLVLWALGMLSAYTAGGLVHLLPVIEAVGGPSDS
jgi:hypothetical protein